MYAGTGVSMCVMYMYRLEYNISVKEVFILKRKSFPFVSLRSENNLIEAKLKIGSEKKRKNITEHDQKKHMCNRSNFASFRL